jgi:hypothetical protein
VLAGADIRTDPGQNEPLRRIDGLSVEKSWATNEGFGMTDAIRGEKKASDAQPLVSWNQDRPSSRVINDCVESEQIYREDKLGCGAVNIRRA